MEFRGAGSFSRYLGIYKRDLFLQIFSTVQIVYDQGQIIFFLTKGSPLWILEKNLQIHRETKCYPMALIENGFKEFLDAISISIVGHVGHSHSHNC